MVPVTVILILTMRTECGVSLTVRREDKRGIDDTFTEIEPYSFCFVFRYSELFNVSDFTKSIKFLLYDILVDTFICITMKEFGFYYFG